MKIKISAAIDTGKERDNNEDALAYCPDLASQQWHDDDMPDYIPLGDCGTLTVVADGMGGANAGEVASSIAINTIKEIFSTDCVKDIVSDDEKIKALLNNAVTTADEHIINKMSIDPETAGMGTTIVICWIINGKAFIAWCGDSRCYVFNPARGLKLLTKDHSFVQELIDSGKITIEEAMTHPDSNIITRGLGDFDTNAVPDIITYDISPNDILLLCSDGLNGYCIDSDIESVLASNYSDVSQCSKLLMQLALSAGGFDNISIIAASLIGDEQEMPSEPTLFQKLKRFLNIG